MKISSFVSRMILVITLLLVSMNLGIAMQISSGLLHKAAFFGDQREIEALLGQGYHINEKGVHGWTILHIAAAEGYYTLVEFLLKQGANPLAVTDNGRTPLDLAKKYKRYDISYLLFGRVPLS